MKNILIAGVGGQGTLLASVVLGKVAMKLGYDVKLSEVHGMAQRGGSVVTYVRMGDCGEKVYSPVIDEGTADVLLAFEQLEGLRWIPYVRKGNAQIYVSTQEILPMPVITGAAAYPKGIGERIKGDFPSAVFVDALEMANKAGSVRTVNMVMIGLLASHSGIDKNIWMEAVGETVKPAFIEMNEKAFETGYSYGRQTNVE